MQWVTVGDPGNTADAAPAGRGAVATSFQIMKYEFTNQQYTDFLNSVDANGTNPNSVYSASIGSNARGGISFTSGAASGSKYAVKTSMGDKPVNYVSWFDAARVSNWYQNGSTSSSSTETGAYALNGATTGCAPAVNNGAATGPTTRSTCSPQPRAFSARRRRASSWVFVSPPRLPCPSPPPTPRPSPVWPAAAGRCSGVVGHGNLYPLAGHVVGGHAAGGRAKGVAATSD